MRDGWTSIDRISPAILLALDLNDLGGHRLHGLARRRFQLKIKGGREPHGRGSRRSLSSASRLRGSPMARMMPRAESILPADKIDHAILQRIEKQAVDGEVAARGVVFGGAERDRVGVAAVAVSGVLTERGHFDRPGRSDP